MRDTIAQIELPNGIKITLDSDEVLKVLRGFTTPEAGIQFDWEKNKVPVPAATIAVSASMGNSPDIPSIEELTESLEEKGKPFSHTLYQEFVGRMGVYPRQNGNLYRRFREVLQGAQAKLANKYNGHWESKRETIEGKPAKRFWLVENESS